MQKLAVTLTDYVINKGEIKETEREIYEYGFQTVLESALSLIISILIAIPLHMIAEGILFFLVFIPLRSYAGGFHLERYLACLTLSCISYSGVLLCAKYIKIPAYLSMLILIALIIAIWLLYPVEHINRPLDKEEVTYFKKRLKVILLVDVIVAVLCLVLEEESYLVLVMVTFLLMVITMGISKIQSHKFH